MNDLFEPLPTRPVLPEPERERWQPLRLGLVELFHYDSEEFWFRDGHLLLRGNNGAGKSKVLSLTLPFLFDAQMRASRIEPDGDHTKKMAWNLLLSTYPRRIGYTWIEFGRRGNDGSTHYLTLGAGLYAVAGRPDVDSWFFILESPGGGVRIGRDFWLTNAQRVVLTRERLNEAVEGCGQVFKTADSYRRAVDERLFHLGTRRYAALMDTLVQLRQPQLSKKPDETSLSNALTEALPPLPQELLADVAEALNQLEEDRRQLDELRELAAAVERFDERYRVYAGMLARRQARELRQAQTDFDKASQTRNHALSQKEAAHAAEEQAQNNYDQAEQRLSTERIRLETLQANPTMQDANRLEQAEKDARKRKDEAKAAAIAREQARQRLEREHQLSEEHTRRAKEANNALIDAKSACDCHAAIAGIGFGTSLLATLDSAALACLPDPEFKSAVAGLREAANTRREQFVLLEHRHTEIKQADSAVNQRRENRDERQFELAIATERRDAADTAAEQAGQLLVDVWSAYCDNLIQLRFESVQPLTELSDWVVDANGGDNPAERALRQAQAATSHRHATRQSELDAQRERLREERSALETEQQALRDGRDATPPAPYTRDTETRRGLSGAPLWQLVDFYDSVDVSQRAGLEAALEAAGLLDAWVTAHGELLSAGGKRLDNQWSMRPPVPGRSLADYLCVSLPPNSPVAADFVERLLQGIANSADDNIEAWVSPDGQYRLGTLAGAWAKPQAVYIGQSARALARQHRLQDIEHRLEQLTTAETELDQLYDRLEADRQQAELEWRDAPSAQALRAALLEAASCERECQSARERLARAETGCREAEQALQQVQDALLRDATDMGFPATAEALPTIDKALRDFDNTYRDLIQDAQAWRRASAELGEQSQREAEAREHWSERDVTATSSLLEAEEAQARFDVLRETIGVQVDELLRQLHDARESVRHNADAARSANEALRQVGEARAQADLIAINAEQSFAQQTEARAAAIVRLQDFAASSLLASALPSLDTPDLKNTWTIDPALALARRMEQELSQLRDDEASWSRVQKQISDDLQELQRALSALGHQAPAEPNAWGFVVHIIFHNRPEHPHQLAAKLADDIAQRTELLSANERTVLENHLQAEIAAEVQRLMRAAAQQVDAINGELQKRPTSTGMRYRLQWLPLSENEGAPIGLDIARERLLNTSADLWSIEDRRAIGVMFQQRIVVERERADADAEHGTLLEQLARALDYRRWHQFRVQRLQDGQWRKLSGPASSGERALGLTVPLFAAIASFYSHSNNTLAPRLMLLDEAFAGIDDDARAHCMGLIREFDLDFVITSEREWACYAALPGVSICQLQRREGIDAVYVSRWTWDGRAKRREEDPNRRFPSA
jgi:uncharacterized protein (TIGR02680 family)